MLLTLMLINRMTGAFRMQFIFRQPEQQLATYGARQNFIGQTDLILILTVKCNQVAAVVVAYDKSALQQAVPGPSGKDPIRINVQRHRNIAHNGLLADCATANRFEDGIHWMDGCLLTDGLEWRATLPAILAAPPDAGTVGEGWHALWQSRLDSVSVSFANWNRERREWCSVLTCPLGGTNKRSAPR